jgi:hypothetical protein
MQKLGRNVPRERGVVSRNVIARSESDEAIQLLFGEAGLLRFARNDGLGCLKIESHVVIAREGGQATPS